MEKLSSGEVHNCKKFSGKMHISGKHQYIRQSPRQRKYRKFHVMRNGEVLKAVKTAPCASGCGSAEGSTVILHTVCAVCSMA